MYKKIYTMTVLFKFSKGTPVANYIANNVTNSLIKVCLYALYKKPVDLLKVPFQSSTCIY